MHQLVFPGHVAHAQFSRGYKPTCVHLPRCLDLIVTSRLLPFLFSQMSEEKASSSSEKMGGEEKSVSGAGRPGWGFVAALADPARL